MYNRYNHNGPIIQLTSHPLPHTGQGPPAAVRLLRRQPDDALPVLADGRCHRHHYDSTAGRVEDPGDERQTGRVRQPVGADPLHGPPGTARLLQGLRAGLRPVGTAHHPDVRVPRAAAHELWLPEAGEEVRRWRCHGIVDISCVGSKIGNVVAIVARAGGNRCLGFLVTGADLERFQSFYFLFCAKSGQ